MNINLRFTFVLFLFNDFEFQQNAMPFRVYTELKQLSLRAGVVSLPWRSNRNQSGNLRTRESQSQCFSSARFLEEGDTIVQSKQAASFYDVLTIFIGPGKNMRIITVGSLIFVNISYLEKVFFL